MKRRELLGSISLSPLLAGCLGRIPGTGSSGSGESGTENSAGTAAELVALVEASLAEGGVEPTKVDQADDILVIEYVSSGDADRATPAEIEFIADVYVSAIADGLETKRSTITATNPQGGSVDAFVIETAWVEAYLDGELEWHEYLERIERTLTGNHEDHSQAAGEGEQQANAPIVDWVRDELTAAGFDLIFIDQIEGVLEIDYLPHGSTPEEIGTEIALVADVYAEAIEQGLDGVGLVARTRHPETDATLDSFIVEATWATQYLTGELSWEEYLSLVDETFESNSVDGDEQPESGGGEDPEAAQDIGHWIEVTLDQHGYSQPAVERSGNSLEVSYGTSGSGSQTLQREIDLLAQLYADALYEGLDAARVNVTRYEAGSDTVLGTFWIDREWVVDYSTGELSPDEFVSRVEDTVDSAG